MTTVKKHCVGMKSRAHETNSRAHAKIGCNYVRRECITCRDLNIDLTSHNISFTTLTIVIKVDSLYLPSGGLYLYTYAFGASFVLHYARLQHTITPHY